MKKYIITFIIILTGLFIAGCVFDHVYYCPYCSTGNVTKQSDNLYKCSNSSCGKTFGAKEL
jgi:uncharacterized alpha/beta hydrolase family protein